MRMILVGLSAALLASCGGVSVSNNASGNAAAPVNSAAPATPTMPGNLVMPGGEDDAGGGNASAGAGGNRDALLASCTAEARGALPQSVDVARLCGCAVDRHLGGATQSEAMRQCATEQNVALPGGPSGG
jgi:hypothetical protein